MGKRLGKHREHPRQRNARNHLVELQALLDDKTQMSAAMNAPNSQ
jgi:hypothetical protein